MSEPRKGPVVDLGRLPIWHGVQSAPGLRSAPFALTLDAAGLVRLQSPETTPEMVERYGADDYNFPTSPPGSSDWGNALAARSLDGLARLVGRLDGHDVLEVGGGTLYCARQMIARMGARTVTLLDPSAREAPDDDRLRVRREYFSSGTEVPRHYAVIVSFNTLEHVPDPEDFLRAAHRHLDDDGRLFIKVPDCARGLDHGDLGLCTHEHLTYFTLDSLDHLLRRVGFRRVAEANYLGALQVLARKATAEPAARCRSTAPLLAGFAKAAEAHMARLRRLGETHPGARVAFVGASVGLSNVLHMSRIADALDVDIYDGDSLKTGKFIPGFARPIRLTDDPQIETHDRIFITPMNFYDEIRAALVRRPGLADAHIAPAFPDGD